jgi:hypothetical protein
MQSMVVSVVLSQRKQPPSTTKRCIDGDDEGCDGPRRIGPGAAMEADFDSALSKTSKPFDAYARRGGVSGGMASGRRCRPWRALRSGRRFHSDLRCDNGRSAEYRLPLDQNRFCRSVGCGFRDPDFNVWPAPSARGLSRSAADQSASTYPVSEAPLRPRWRYAHPGPHKLSGLEGH